MNNLEQSIIDNLAPEILGAFGFGSGISGSRVWNDVKMFVQDVDGETGLTGEQKKAKVKKDLVAVFGDVAEFVLNAAVEIAVVWLRAGAPV
jgi:hypothetical protein